MNADALARAAHDLLVKSAKVENLYAGDCRGCGECCSRFLPVTQEDRVRLAWHLAENPVAARPQRGEVDLVCPLLSDSCECMAYEARPAICRTYRCDLHAKGLLRHGRELDGATIVDMRELVA